jgi:predicted O-methyltransferase YrrM
MAQAIINIQPPIGVSKILAKTAKHGFQMASDSLVGSLLRTLAASKPNGRLLELGTGTGLSTAWLLSGMTANSVLLSVENDSALMAIAQECLGEDPRVRFYAEDAGQFIEQLTKTAPQFDLIFADTWAGKYTHLEAVVKALNPGGLYIIDDMLPQANWPEGHKAKADALITVLENHADLILTRLNWSTGVIIATNHSK